MRLIILRTISIMALCKKKLFVFLIATGLHPDESDHDEGGWLVGWQRLGAESFQRDEAGELSDVQLYPYQAAQAALKMAGAG